MCDDSKLFESNVTDQLNGTCDPIPLLHGICKHFKPVFFPLACILCGFGIIGNSLNILIFTHKSFISSTNILIACLSFSDLMCHITYLFFVLFYRDEFYTTEGEALNRLVLVSALHFFHTFTSGMLVALGIFRVLYVRAGNRAASIYTMKKAFVSIFLVTILSLIIIIPYITGHSVTKKGEHYIIDYQDKGAWKIILFLTVSVVVKGIPCLILAFCSAYLIMFIVRSQKLRKKLCSNRSTLIKKKETSNGYNHNTPMVKSEEKSDTASKHILYMLLSIMLLYIITYLPQTIVVLVTYSKMCMIRQYYDPLGEIFDVLTLIDSSAGFLFYIGLSAPYRKTAIQIAMSLFSRKTPSKLNLNTPNSPVRM